MGGLIWSIVKRYSGCGVDTDDLYQLGCIGFIKAVKGFDLTYGTQFSTYAVPKIAGEIRRFLRDGSVKVGRSLREKGQTLFYTRERLRHTLGREPQLSELAQETGMTVEEVAAVGSWPTGRWNPSSRETIDGLTLESTFGDRQPGGGDGRENSAAGSHRQPAGAGKDHHTSAFFRGMTQEQTARILKVSQVRCPAWSARDWQSSGKF